MLRLDDLHKTYGPQTILEGAELTIHPNEKVGIVGPNGVGKTTLFRILDGSEEADKGDVRWRGRIRVGMLRQELDPSERSALQEVMAGDIELTELHQEREALVRELGDPGDAILTDTLSKRLGEVDHRMEELDAYDAEARAGTILSGLGFSPEEIHKSQQSFSGGWRMRIALAKLLFSRPDVLLLDEPTNHLDLESAHWLEQYLARRAGTVLVISHDRGFLNRVVGVIVALEGARLTRYVGNFENYLTRRAEMFEQQARYAARQEKRRAEIQRFIDRFRAKATKARQVKSREKMLQRMEPVAQVAGKEAVVKLRLPTPTPAPAEPMTIRDGAKGYGDKPVLEGVNLTLERGEKLGILGPNGTGKSTLLKLLAGALEPDEGEWIRHDKTVTAYFAQHALEALPMQETVLVAARQAAPSGWNEQALRTLLGSFLFSGETVMKLVSVLSGGERARLALARLFLTGANLLLLDEPTNHLDMSARLALEEALEAFPGGFLLVSHDRDLLETVCDGYLILEGRGVSRLEGGLAAYLELVTQGRASEKRDGNSAAMPSSPAQKRKDRKRQEAEIRNRLARDSRALRRLSEKLEAKIQKLEEEKGALDETMGDSTLYEEQNKPRLMELMARGAELDRMLQESMEAWETATLEIEAQEQAANDALEALNQEAIS
ncbi:MAG: ABC-F family ATP-binding cassette domain-containing protein [Magnetococcales bacterium]|nr:ABC-F family ATP-binding cassette domain-containing protein [Magnetococcales bacterium]